MQKSNIPKNFEKIEEIDIKKHLVGITNDFLEIAKDQENPEILNVK